MRDLEETVLHLPALEDNDTAACATERVSLRQALKTYVPPVITAIGLVNVVSIGGSGPTNGNNGFGQEKHGAPKDGPPAGKLENDKPGSR